MRDAFRLFMRRPLPFAGMFVSFLVLALLVTIVPVVGGVAMLMALPLLSLGFMLASRAALDDLPGVAASAVIGVPHPDFGEAVVACLVPVKGAVLGEEAVRAALRERLAAFKIPKRVLVLEDLPRNAMGKVQKAELRRAHAGLFSLE